MLSAHNADEALTIAQKYDELSSGGDLIVKDVQSAIFSFANEAVDKKTLTEHLSLIKHRKQLKQAREAISFIFQKHPPLTACTFGFRMLDALSCLKDSLALALGNQITCEMASLATLFDSESKSVIITLEATKTLEKIVILNYLLSKQDAKNQSHDLWNAVYIMEAFGVDGEIAELDKVVDFEQDFCEFRRKSPHCFCRHPTLLSIAAKQSLLRIESRVSMRHELQDSFFTALFAGVQCPFLNVCVRRGCLLADTMTALRTVSNFRKQLKVQFVGEAGVDEGGLQKEFFLLCKSLMFDDRALFPVLNDHYIWFISNDSNNNDNNNDNSAEDERLWLAGVLLGLAVYNHVQLDVSFPIALYKSLLQHPVELRDIDSVLARSLENYGGDQSQLAHDKLQELQRGLLTLTKGFQCVLPPPPPTPSDAPTPSIVYSCITPSELEQLVRGKDLIDMPAVAQAATYQGGYTPDTPVIRWLWDIVLGTFDRAQQTNLFRFVTGSDRLPVTGAVCFCVCRAGPDAERLPTSQTCFNTLLLNEYSTRDKLLHYLLLALDNIEGFGLC